MSKKMASAHSTAPVKSLPVNEERGLTSNLLSDAIDENYILKKQANSANLNASGSLAKGSDGESEANIAGGFEMVSPKDSLQSDKEMITEFLHKLLKSELITIEDKGNIIHCMHTVSLRNVVADVLLEINSPKPLKQLECLRQLADIIKFILTLFVHEQSNDYKLLHAVLSSSHHIYYLS